MEERSKELLKKVNEFLKEEGIDISNTEIDAQTLMQEFLLPGLKNSKDVLSALYSFQVKPREGFVGRLKSLVQRKLTNSTINVIEKQAMRQQKFNELVYRTLEVLANEKGKEN